MMVVVMMTMMAIQMMIINPSVVWATNCYRQTTKETDRYTATCYGQTNK